MGQAYSELYCPCFSINQQNIRKKKLFILISAEAFIFNNDMIFCDPNTASNKFKNKK